MKNLLTIIFLLLFSVFAASESLNLVEIQKKEKERRKKAGKSKYVLTNNSISKYSLKKGKTFITTDREIIPDKESSAIEDKKIKKKKTEEYWRGRLKSLNEQISDLKRRIQEAQSTLNRESSNFLVASMPSLQQQIKINIDNIRKRLLEMKNTLKQRESDRDAFYREARKAGVLPGWLR